jgi:hypothetical protein
MDYGFVNWIHLGIPEPFSPQNFCPLHGPYYLANDNLSIQLPLSFFQSLQRCFFDDNPLSIPIKCCSLRVAVCPAQIAHDELPRPRPLIDQHIQARPSLSIAITPQRTPRPLYLFYATYTTQRPRRHRFVTTRRKSRRNAETVAFERFVGGIGSTWRRRWYTIDRLLEDA